MISKIIFSYIIPTIGRASLETAVKSVLNQDFFRAEFEIIVVNDSGNPLPAADWHASPRVRIIHTNNSERCFARNSGAAVAKGKYLAFLDDDDWILPGALESLWNLAKKYPNAAWLYGGIRIIDEKGKVLAEINSGLNGNRFAQIMSGAWAPIQASLVDAHAFFEVGMFNPLISVTEDEDLCRRVAGRHELANTLDTVAVLYRGQIWNTSSNYQRAPEDVKYSRDLILSEPGVLQRLMASADSAFWHGRILRVYLSTIAWNWKKKRFFTALSRVFFSAAVFMRSIPHVFSREYWSGLKAHHVPDTLHFVMEEYERNRIDGT
jgi:glycosyltransferase involved in cell wall biosynthesis